MAQKHADPDPQHRIQHCMCMIYLEKDKRACDSAKRRNLEVKERTDSSNWLNTKKYVFDKGAGTRGA